MTARALPDFARVAQGRRVALVHPDFVPQVSDALLNGSGLSPAGLRGRGGMESVATPRGEVLIRKYLRGGMIAPVLRDAYLMSNRAARELAIHQHAWRGGVPTVLPVGAMWERSGLVYRGMYATLRVDAEDLLAYLARVALPRDRGAATEPAIGREPGLSQTLLSCGRAIRAMHEAGIYHADLQVKNILVSGGDALIIDFDGARLSSVTPALASRNLTRLRRSFLKRGLNAAHFEAIEAAYRKP